MRNNNQRLTDLRLDEIQKIYLDRQSHISTHLQNNPWNEVGPEKTQFTDLDTLDTKDKDRLIQEMEGLG
ncbi:MAG TPA: hypothetical protein PLJ21_11345, partial [Pseudobdellovibrionaceae bacterium]|nr:hypothetical protein [Pseudobdellovibrionaceae bacterium]